MSGTGDSKHQSKSSVKADANPDDGRGFHAVVAKWDESPDGQRSFEVWKLHGFSITIICITIFLLIYGIVAIAVRGFETAQLLFGITMLLWFCMTYMFALHPVELKLGSVTEYHISQLPVHFYFAGLNL